MVFMAKKTFPVFLLTVQISYSSTSEHLSRKLKFPTFLRTISSDEHQTLAIVGLVRQFNWKTVAIIGSDDAYGKYGSDKIASILREKQDICIEFTDILPDYFSLNTSQAHSRLDKLVRSISRSSAEAVIIFTKGKNADIIMKEAVKHNLNRTWIASDAWSISSSLSALPGIERAGEVFGIISKKNEVPGFKEHVMSKFSGTTNALLEHYLTLCPPCADETDKNKGGDCPLANSPPDSQRCVDLSCLAEYINEYNAYNVFLAVQVIIKGLVRLLKCDNHRCKHSGNFTALEVRSHYYADIILKRHYACCATFKFHLHNRFYDSLPWDGESGGPATDAADLAALLLDYITLVAWQPLVRTRPSRLFHGYSVYVSIFFSNHIYRGLFEWSSISILQRLVCCLASFGPATGSVSAEGAILPVAGQ